jgi:hypothetical protein
VICDGQIFEGRTGRRNGHGLVETVSCAALTSKSKSNDRLIINQSWHYYPGLRCSNDVLANKPSLEKFSS